MVTKLIFGTKCFIPLGDDKRSLARDLKNEKARAGQLEQNCDKLRDEVQMLTIEANNRSESWKNNENGYLQIIKDLKTEHQDLTLQLK